MFKKINTKWLSGVFITLLVIVVILLVKDAKQGSRSFKSDITGIDTSKVEQIVILPRSAESELELIKENGTWRIKIEESWYNADKRQVENMMGLLSELKAKRLAATSKTRWEEFEVTDSLATRVKFISSKKTLLDIFLGKFSFQQIPSQNPYQQPRNQMSTYVRLAGEKEVYNVDGILSMSFNRSAGDLRDNTIVSANRNDLNKITINSPAGTTSLVKEGNAWMLDGLVTDSAATATYLDNVTRLSNSNFVERDVIREQNASYTIQLDGENLQQITVQAFLADTTHGYALESNLNPGTYFSGKKSGAFDKLFVKREEFFIVDQTIE